MSGKAHNLLKIFFSMCMLCICLCLNTRKDKCPHRPGGCWIPWSQRGRWQPPDVDSGSGTQVLCKECMLLTAELFLSHLGLTSLNTVSLQAQRRKYVLPGLLFKGISPTWETRVLSYCFPKDSSFPNISFLVMRFQHVTWGTGTNIPSLASPIPCLTFII